MMWCGHLNAIYLVATREHEPSPALDDVISHVKQMHEQVKGICGAYDKLRSLMGELELEQGVTPRFYVDPMAGKIDKPHCPNLL